LTVRNALIEQGAQVNKQPTIGQYGTALIAAAASENLGNKLDILKYLIKRGARVNEQTMIGKYGSALVAAASCQDPVRVQLLIDRGADVNLPLRSGDYFSALAALARRHRERNEFLLEQQMAIKRMIDKGADVDKVLRESMYGPAFLETFALCRGKSIESFESNVKRIKTDRIKMEQEERA
jgi:hypothetical protein